MSDGDDSTSKTERRIATLEEAVRLLTELALRADERMDALTAAQTDSERRIAALADAQIRTEESLVQLSAAQAHTDQRLDALIDIVREKLGGQSQS